MLASSSGSMIPVISSATGEQVCQYQAAGTTDIDSAVAVAHQAQIEWAKCSPTARGRILTKCAELLTKENDYLAGLETLDTSRPIQETNCVDIVSARDAFEYYGGIASTIGGDFIHQPGRSFAYTVREPLGVTCGIGAWNYPIQSAGWKGAPSLACGNSILFKPSEATPLTALAMAEVLQQAGLPDGLFNVILGARSTGEDLVNHIGIKKVSFTGSQGTGKAIFKSSSDSLKKLQMELGGKSPFIVFEDADMEQAVSGALMANFYSTGQVCSNGTRVFVQSSIKEEFTKEFVRRAALIKLGDPTDLATQMGPLIHHQHLDHVMEYIEIGKNEGATLLTGGERVKMTGKLAKGPYISPAIFDNCHDDMRIVREEIFGPVAAILSFETEEEVIRRANDTVYGLSAGVFTKDLQRAHRVIRDIDAGTTWINNYNLAPAELPWTAHKGSGMGVSNGIYGVDDWTQLKSCYVEMDRIYCPYE